jgi:uncharacterized protein (TIGR03067 family)
VEFAPLIDRAVQPDGMAGTASPEARHVAAHFPRREGAVMFTFLKRAAVAALALLTLVPLLCAAEPDPEPISSAQADLKKMQGTWVEVTKQKGVGIVLVIKKDQVVIREKNSNRMQRTTIELDARKKPPTFDLTLEKAKLATVRGIYKFGKDELTIAFTENLTKARPTKFDGKDCIKLVLKRQRSKE